MNPPIPIALPSFAFIAAAGTGGHIIPGLAIAAQLQKKNWEIEWIGTHHGMENTLVPPQHIVLNRLNFAGLRGKGGLGLFKGLGNLLFAWIKCLRLMYAQKKRLHRINSVYNLALIGMGGYICVPASWAAWILNIPIILINADADLLLSNKSVAKLATTICCGFEGNASKLNNAIVTGNPVRSQVAELAVRFPIESRYQSRSGGLNILVIGGSLGAHILNEYIPKALKSWAILCDTSEINTQTPIKPLPNIWHQSGSQHVTFTKNNYALQGIQAQVVPFIDDIAAAYQWADVVICRAGAITVSELCAAGVAAILIPLLNKTTNHQAGNAMYLATHQAAIHIAQTELSPDGLANILNQLNREQLKTMASAALNLNKPDSTQAVIHAIEQSVIKK